MLRSMTGFATHSSLITIDTVKVPLTLSIKSLNTRYFDAMCKLPYPLSNLETEFVKLFKTHLYRGSITFIIHLGNSLAFKGHIEPSIPTLKNYLSALETIQKTFALEGTLSIANILLLPNIFITEDKELDLAAKEIIFEQVRNLLNELVTVQLKEGAALYADLQERITHITREMTSIKKAFELLLENQKQKIADTLCQNDQSALAEIQKNALYVVLDKMDVHEEIIRFSNHLATLTATLESKEVEKGRRLDFILQELSREINTITAKCSDSTISSHAINIKVELEKAREQVQNIV